MIHDLIKLMRNTRGATAVEYGLVVALIVIAAAGGISVLGSATGGAWGNINSKIGNVLPSS